MNLNVTAGVFMVLMVALATALLLCCCKAYVICKRRQRVSRNSTNRRTLRSRLHQHLPIGKSYNDEPPCYDDILSGRIPSKIASTLDSDDVISLSDTDAKPTGDTIVVKWSCDEDDTESIDPPLYACVVIENETLQSELPPPSYYENKNSRKISTKKSFGNSGDANTTKNSFSQKILDAINSVSVSFGGAKITNHSDNEPDMEISCNSNVMETPTSSNVTSASSSSAQSLQEK